MAVLLAISASLLWGSADFGGGLLSRRRPALAVTVVSQAFALLALCALATGQAAWARPGGYLPYGVIAGLLGSIGLTALYRALAVGPMGLVAAVAATAVLLPVTVGISTGERPGAVRYGGMALAVAGVVLAGGPEFRTGQRLHRTTMLLALLAAVCIGGYYQTMAGTAQQNLPMVLVTQRLTNLVFGSALLLTTGTTPRVSRRELPTLAFVGLADVTANASYALATRTGLVAVVAVLSSLYPLVTALLARGLLGERLRPIQQLGAVAALTGAVLLASAS